MADDDPVNDQLIDSPSGSRRSTAAEAIAKYVVPDPRDNSVDLHEILPEDQLL
jgi:hypothetical protein